MKTHHCNHTPPLGDSSRRAFLKTTAAGFAGAAFGGAAGPVIAAGDAAASAPTSETLATQLYGSLSEQQKNDICFAFDHPLRSKVDANWHITKPKVGSEFFKADQQELIKEIFMGMHSEDYAQKVYDQVVHDSGKQGFGASSVAMFGEPGSGKFEFVLTGRHCTRRCDGDSVAGAAFGGPIFYGHAAQGFNEKANHPGNAYWYQAKRANEVYEMLDGKQREIALIDDEGREEDKNNTVALTGKSEGLDGIRFGDLAPDQRKHVRKVLKDLLAPFRKSDVEEAMKLVKKGGMKNLHMAFYKQQDIGDDGVWDVWQLEGPNIVWYFRGDPHVHVWAHIRDPKSVDPAKS